MFSAYRRLCAPLSRKIHSFVRTATTSAAALPEGLQIFPEFLSLIEQRMLLSAALSRLDSTETKQTRKRRRDLLANHPREGGTIEDVFLPDAYYNFEEVARRLHHQELGL
jgi:alkylated DNA repair protein alkB family protein 7